MSKIAKISAFILISMAIAGLAAASDGDYSTVHYPKIVDLNAQGVASVPHPETVRVAAPAPVDPANKALTFYNNKLAKIWDYIAQLEGKLKIAEIEGNTDREVQLNNLIAKQYKRVEVVNTEIARRQGTLEDRVATVTQVAQETPLVEKGVVENKKGILAGVETDMRVNIDTRSKENAPVDSASVSANFTARKGPVYIEFTHSREYSREIDFAHIRSEFEGMVNNRISVGLSFSPEGEGNPHLFDKDEDEDSEDEQINPVVNISSTAVN